MEATEHLRLDRAHANLAFDSWGLGSGLTKSASADPLPFPACRNESSDTDYAHVRNAALHNGLTSLPAGTFFFLAGPAGVELHRITGGQGVERVCGTSKGSLDIRLSFVCCAHAGSPRHPSLCAAGVPPLPHNLRLAEPALLPTVVEVEGGPDPASPSLLVSSGAGELSLWRLPSGAAPAECLAPPAAPLRPAPPLRGVRPLQLCAAAYDAHGRIVAVVYAVRGSSAAVPACCEIYCLTLELPRAPDADALAVAEVQFLQKSRIPPHGALCNPHTGADAEAADDDADLSPRTLQAAAARLAHLTSEEVEGPTGVPRNQYANVFRESGPDGIGAMGSEPSCALLVYLPERSSKGAMVCKNRLLCQPHRVLGCQRAGRARLLLGLTDDVDCAVLEISVTLPASELDVPSASMVGALPGYAVRHVASVPALAYVAAGKLQRKYLLLGAPGCTLAATLVEAHQYCYLYRKTEVDQPRGEQQVVELLGLGGGVLGAALLPAAASVSGGATLVVLGESGLLRFNVE